MKERSIEAGGNLTLAKSYMKKAGFPSGMYTGPPLLTA